MQLHKILSCASFSLILVGASGFAGTMELEPVDGNGVALSLAMVLAGILCGVWAAWEDGGFRRWTGRQH